jgi:aerobic C4-dicarboxylate transport protein
MAAIFIFIAQATNTPLTLTDQLVVLGVQLLTSKGSAGVTGSGFITLAATLASMGKIPVAGMVLLLGVDRFMSEARAITNTIGNAVGTVAIARWVGSVDRQRLTQVLDGKTDPEDLHALYEGNDDSNVKPILGDRVARAAACIGCLGEGALPQQICYRC